MNLKPLKFSKNDQVKISEFFWATIAKIFEAQPGLGANQTAWSRPAPIQINDLKSFLIHQTEIQIPVRPSIFIIRKVIKWLTWFIEQTQYQKEISEIEYF